MANHDLNAKINEKLERKMEQLRRKLEELPGDEDIRQQLKSVGDELAKVEAELHAFVASEEQTPGLHARLEAHRERLLAQAERLELRREVALEKRERLQEAMEELQGAFARHTYIATPSFSPAPPVPPQDLRKMQEERRKILNMVQEGKITADEAARLLDALRDQMESSQQRKRKPRWVRIRVTDVEAKRVRVNLTLPVGLVRAGLRAGGSIAGMEGLNTGELEEMLNRGEVGHILDMQDADGGERVEIFIE
jgi:hypothetical protein